MKGILRPRNYLKFPSVKVIVKEIAYKSLKNSKKAYFGPFLRTDNQNLEPEIFFRDFRYVIRIENMFKPIRAINRTDSRAIWMRICEENRHFAKSLSPLAIKNISKY